MPMRSPLRSDLQGARDTLRLEALSDGVIAIAITLLILEIRVPEVDESSPQEAWAALRALWPQYLGYLISFATIGIMWANHHLIFGFIARTNHYLILANLFLLLCIAAIPFPTALMADTLGHPAERVGVTVYSGWFVVCARGLQRALALRGADQRSARAGCGPSGHRDGDATLSAGAAGLSGGVPAGVRQSGRVVAGPLRPDRDLCSSL